MNVLKRIARFFIVLLFSSPLLAMDGQNSDDNLLKQPSMLLELRLQILPYQDYKTQGIMVDIWDDLDDEKVWRPYAQNCFGAFANELKQAGETWRDAILRYHQTIIHVLSMETWAKEDVQMAISVENSVKLEKLLLKNLKLTIISNIKPLVKSSNDLWAALLAYAIIYDSIAHDAASFVARNASPDDSIEDCLGNSAWKAVWAHDRGTARITYSNFFCTVRNMPKYAVLGIAYDAAFLNSCSPTSPNSSVFNALFDIAYDDNRKAIEKLPIDSIFEDSINIGNSYWMLGNIFMLAYVSKSDFYSFYQKAFDSAKKVLDADVSFKISKEEILALFANEIWEKEELKENPYILLLRHIAESLSQGIK